MRFFNYDWAVFAEYCYRSGRNAAWNFDGWLGELLFKQGESWRERFYAVKRLLNQTNPKEIVLDVMCGGAYPSRNLAKENKSLFICVDIVLDYLRFAKSRAEKEGVKDRIDFVRCDARCLPFKNKSVDLALGVGGPEYLPASDLKNFLRQIKTITKGHVIFTFTIDIFKKKLFYRMGLYSLRFLLCGIRYHGIYSVKEILDLFDSFGFKQPEFKIVGDYHMIIKAET